METVTTFGMQRPQDVFGIEYDQRPADIEKQLARCITFFDNTAKNLSSR